MYNFSPSFSYFREIDFTQYKVKLYICVSKWKMLKKFSAPIFLLLFRLIPIDFNWIELNIEWNVSYSLCRKIAVYFEYIEFQQFNKLSEHLNGSNILFFSLQEFRSLFYLRKNVPGKKQIFSLSRALSLSRSMRIHWKLFTVDNGFRMFGHLFVTVFYLHNSNYRFIQVGLPLFYWFSASVKHSIQWRRYWSDIKCNNGK